MCAAHCAHGFRTTNSELHSDVKSSRMTITLLRCVKWC